MLGRKPPKYKQSLNSDNKPTFDAVFFFALLVAVPIVFLSMINDRVNQRNQIEQNSYMSIDVGSPTPTPSPTIAPTVAMEIPPTSTPNNPAIWSTNDPTLYPTPTVSDLPPDDIDGIINVLIFSILGLIICLSFAIIWYIRRGANGGNIVGLKG